MHYGHWSGARVFIGEHQMGWRLQFAGAKDAQNNVSETVKIRDPALINCALAPYNFTNCEKKGYFTCVSTKVCIPPSQLCDYQVKSIFLAYFVATVSLFCRTIVVITAMS